MSEMEDPAYVEFLKQLESMRQAIAELKLDQEGIGRPTIDVTASDDDDLVGGSGSDDIWDISSEGEDVVEDDSDNGFDDSVSEGTPAQLCTNSNSFDQGWLRRKSTACASNSSGLDATELEEQILVMLASDSQSRFMP